MVLCTLVTVVAEQRFDGTTDMDGVIPGSVAPAVFFIPLDAWLAEQELDDVDVAFGNGDVERGAEVVVCAAKGDAQVLEALELTDVAEGSCCEDGRDHLVLTFRGQLCHVVPDVAVGRVVVIGVGQVMGRRKHVEEELGRHEVVGKVGTSE